MGKKDTSYVETMKKESIKRIAAKIRKGVMKNAGKRSD